MSILPPGPAPIIQYCRTSSDDSLTTAISRSKTDVPTLIVFMVGGVRVELGLVNALGLKMRGNAPLQRLCKMARQSRKKRRFNSYSEMGNWLTVFVLLGLALQISGQTAASK